MKAILGNSLTAVRITPVIALKHPSYKSPFLHAAAALHHLSEQYNRKKKRTAKKAGHA